MKNGFLLLALLGASSYAQTGTFAETGRMISPRFGHTATLLPNGKVLIAGGVEPNWRFLSMGLLSRNEYAPLVAEREVTFSR